MKLNIINVLNYLMVSTIFISSMVLPTSFQFEFYFFYLIYALFIWLLLARQKDIAIQKVFLFGFITISGISITNAVLSNVQIFLVIKQIIGIGFSSIAFYLLFKINDYKVGKLFQIYMKLAVLASILALIQEISYLLAFTPGYSLSSWVPFVLKQGYGIGKFSTILRVTALSQEPSHLAGVLFPAMFFAFRNVFFAGKQYVNKFQSLIILLAVFFTLSTVAFLGLVMLVIYFAVKQLPALFKSKRSIIWAVIVSVIIMPAIVTLPYFISSDINLRINDAIKVMSGYYNNRNYKEMNLSVFALYGNYFVVAETFKQNPVFGTSLGSYPESFDKYSVPFFLGMDKVNREDAGSLFLRLVSETGLLGIVICAYFLIKNYIYSKELLKGDSNMENLLLINNSVFILILLRLLRMGHYFVDGFFFFVFLYYFSAKEFRRNKHETMEFGK